MGINCVCIIHDDDVVLWPLQQRVVSQNGAPVGAVPRCFSATTKQRQQLFCRGDREASRGEFDYSCHRHGWRAAGLYRPGEKSVGRRDDDEKKHSDCGKPIIFRRGGPIGRRWELFRPLLGAFFWVLVFFVFLFFFFFFFVVVERFRYVFFEPRHHHHHHIRLVSTFL